MEWIPKQRIVWGFNKQPARTYYYLVLAGLEIAMADLVRWRYGKNQSNLIGFPGSRDAEQLMEPVEMDRRASADGDLVSYLDFKHLLRIFEKDRALRAELGRYGRDRWNARTRPLGDLRNEVMHPVTTLVTSPEDMVTLARSIETTVELVDKAILALRKRYPATKSE